MRVPRIGVALATRNGELYLAEQLASIVGQSRPVDHVVVSDDASSDGTVALAERLLLEAGIAHVVLSHDPPLGITRNFEAALAASDADIILLSDQDDVWAPDRVAASIDAFIKQPHLLALHADARLVDASGKPLGLSLFDALEISDAALRRISAGDSFPLFLRRNLATGATMAVRRELIEAARPFPEEWVHDEWLAVRAAARERLGVLDRPVIDYRQHGANAIGVEPATFAYKVRRVLEPRGDRNAALVRRSAVLVECLESDPDVPEAVVADARGKLAFEGRRAALPASRWARLGRVVGDLWHGDYARWASRGRADVVRDLLQGR